MRVIPAFLVPDCVCVGVGVGVGWGDLSDVWGIKFSFQKDRSMLK